MVGQEGEAASLTGGATGTVGHAVGGRDNGENRRHGLEASVGAYQGGERRQLHRVPHRASH